MKALAINTIRTPEMLDLRGALDAPIRFGMMVAAIALLFFGVWAGFAPINSASIAPGYVVVDSNRKTIQHLEGGIIAELLVKEGDAVKAGQELVKLNHTRAKASREIVTGKLIAARLAEARLMSERDNKDTLEITPELDEFKTHPDYTEILQNQTNMFNSRRQSYTGQMQVLDQRIAQLNDKLDGLDAQRKASERQQSLLNEEIGSIARLVKKGMAVKPRLLSLQRDQASQQGNIGSYIAESSNTKEKISETETQKINLQTEYNKEVATDLSDTQKEIADLMEQYSATSDVYARTTIVAPQDGVITGLKYHTIGGVIEPGAPIMDIVPRDDTMVIEARIPAQDIDQVHQGLSAKVRLSAYRSSFTPRMDGVVEYVSADRFTDERNSSVYYTARVHLDDDEVKKFKDKIKLYPGMPAEVMIVTGEHTLLEYLLAPFLGSVQRSFSED